MGLKILIIEDDLMTIKLYEEVFKMEGFEIEILDCGKAAIKALEEIRKGKKEKPDLILLDLILPDMHGLEILKEAKRYPQTAEIKIFALTNYSNPEIDKELTEGGIDKILVKARYTLKGIAQLIKETFGE
jgi:CheY-like chemotaxis protein